MTCHYCGEPMRRTDRRALATLWRSPMPTTVQRPFHAECVERYEVMPGALTVAAAIYYTLSPPHVALYDGQKAAQA